MLPGFRFLFAAIMLSMSLLVFGLGATALLRSAHEEFASNPAWRAAPEVKFAQRTEATTPVLATLRVETPEQKTPEDATAPAARAEAETTTSPTTAAQALPSEAAGPEIPSAPKQDAAVADSNRPASEAAPASPQSESVERGAAAGQPGEGSGQEARDENKDETGVAAIVSTAPSPPDDPPVAAATDPSAADAAPAAASISTDPAATKIATLGGPPVDIETPTKANETASKADASGAKPDESAAKKRAEAKRAARHRIAAARARLAAQQAQQLQAGPFFQQPTPTVRAR
ncbi:MAG: hypothetical protein WA820_10740 [Bradyrhizobium sp.]|jgi:hypothetical protein